MKPTSGRLRPDQHVEFQRQRNNTDYIAFALIGTLAGVGISVDLKLLLIIGLVGHALCAQLFHWTFLCTRFWKARLYWLTSSTRGNNARFVRAGSQTQTGIIRLHTIYPCFNAPWRSNRSGPSMDCIEDNVTTAIILPNLWCRPTTQHATHFGPFRAGWAKNLKKSWI